MSIFLDISAALDDWLKLMPSVPDGVAWANINFEPTLGELYIRPALLPGDSKQSSLGDNGLDENIGVYQVDIFAPAGEGKNEAMTMADTIADRFKRGTDLTYNSRTVTIRNVNQLPAIITGDGWFKVSIEIVYFAFTAARA